MEDNPLVSLVQKEGGLVLQVRIQITLGSWVEGFVLYRKQHVVMLDRVTLALFIFMLNFVVVIWIRE